MAKRPLPCPTVIRLLLNYDAETGLLDWKEAPKLLGRRHRTGKQAFNSPTVYGYLQGGVGNGVCHTHRVIWAIVHGYWPKQIDHINGIRTDNRLENLREVDDAENRKNTAIRSDNKSGYHGIRWRADLHKWRAEIRINGKSKHIGVYTSKDDAIAARRSVEAELGFHPNHGRGR